MLSVCLAVSRRWSGGLIAVSLGCTTAAPVETPATSSSPAVVAPEPIEVATPRSPHDAGVLFTELEARRRAGDRAGVVARARALLRTDFLSDLGRANLYWLIAETSRGDDVLTHMDALGAFLVAASMLPPEPELVVRQARAHAWLIAAKIQASSLGRTPDDAIPLASQDDADRVVAALSCGRRGSPYVERRLPGDVFVDGLQRRQLLCTETGESLTIWLRIGAPSTTTAP